MFSSGPERFAIAFLSLLVHVRFGTQNFCFPSNLPIQLIWFTLEQNKHILKDGLKIALHFPASLFMKSTEPTNIFKLGVKETGQSVPTIWKLRNAF